MFAPFASACPPPGRAGSLGSACSGAVVSAASAAAVAGGVVSAYTDMLPIAPTASIAAVTGTRSHFFLVFMVCLLSDESFGLKVTTWREAKMKAGLHVPFMWVPQPHSTRTEFTRRLICAGEHSQDWAWPRRSR